MRAPREAVAKRAGTAMLPPVRSFALAACGSIVLACGASRPAPIASPAAEAAHPLRAPRRFPIAYALEGRPFPLPIARVTVAGVPTLALVDSGANSHVIAGWLARKAGLSTVVMGDMGTDHTGSPIATRRAPRGQIAIESWGPLPDAPALVTEVPEAVARLGIGVFLSPQQLASERYPVLLDLRERELREAPDEADFRSISRGASALTALPARACIDEESPLLGRVFVVRGKVRGESVDLLLDTGAQHTDVLASSAAGKALAPLSAAGSDAVYAASGKVSTRTVQQASVAIGEVAAVVDVDIIAGQQDPFCPRDGVVAMDVLSRCAMLFRDRNVRVVCR